MNERESARRGLRGRNRAKTGAATDKEECSTIARGMPLRAVERAARRFLVEGWDALDELADDEVWVVLDFIEVLHPPVPTWATEGADYGA